MKRTLAVMALFIALLALPSAALAGEDVGLSWADCVVAPESDADLDGLDDACEYAVAARFEPELVFGAAETATGRIPFWAAKPEGARMMRVFYALSYLVDAGDPTFGGASGHDGDTEFIVLRIEYVSGSTWQLVDGYLSAHFDTLCDAGGWFTHDQFEYAGAARGKPVVYVAEGKHANYVSLADCDAGGCYQDHCSDTVRAGVGIAASRDLGLFGQQLLDEHVVNGNHEWFWTDTIFCGWQRPPGDARDGCVPAGNTYAIQLTQFEMLHGPVGVTPMCGSCVDSLECADGGACMPIDAELVCGRACGGKEPCPAGSSCATLSSGEQQCVADLACSCVTACFGKECGDDGCGGTCGACPGSMACDAGGACVSGSAPVCSPCPAGTECAPGLACATSADGQRTYCVEPCDQGACASGFTCAVMAGEERCLPAAAPACHEGDVWSVDACGRALSLTISCDGAPCSEGACACAPSCEAKSCDDDDGCGSPCKSACTGGGAETEQGGGCGCELARTRTDGAALMLAAAAVVIARRRRSGEQACRAGRRTRVSGPVRSLPPGPPAR